MTQTLEERIQNYEAMLRNGCDLLRDPEATTMAKHKTLQTMEGLCRNLREGIEQEVNRRIDEHMAQAHSHTL